MPKKTSIKVENGGERKPTSEAVVSFSQKDMERTAQANLSEADLGRIRQYRTLRGKQFIFRCFIMPWFSWRVSLLVEKLSPTLPYRMHLPYSYRMAQSRTLGEMSFQKELTFDDSERVREFCFDEERCDYWLGRFDAWLDAINRAFRVCLERKGGIANFPDRLAHAAELGAIHHLWDGIPKKALGIVVAKLRQQSKDHFRVFHKQAVQPRCIKWLDPEFDLWLIEIWPLVLGYDWTYSGAWRVAREKFPNAGDETRKALESPEALSNHCKMKGLDLKLSPKAGCGGRPRRAPTPLPPLADLALQIDGFSSPGVCGSREEIRIAWLSGAGYRLICFPPD